MDLGRTPTAASTARHWLVVELLDLGIADALGAERVESAQLMLSELVANVVLHTRSSAFVSVGVHPGELVVSVADDDPALPAVASRPLLDTGGRGLNIVARLAARWGATPLASGGKAVWFSVPCG